MGEVYRARDLRLGRDVAIKVSIERFSGRFEREARAIAALNHPHICTLYDVGPDYLVMEYIEGKPVCGPVATKDAVRLAIQIASALEAAHKKRVLHRDLKPRNILVTETGPKLLDFGLAYLATDSDSDADATKTIEGTVIGTAAYMSPEQAQGKPLDERSDVFSFGAVLYELLSGSRAFGGSSSAAVLSLVLRDEPRPLQVPAEVSRIVARCLSKAPAARFQTMTEVRTALEQLSLHEAEKQRSIAVLPFKNMSGDKEQEYFSDGLAEEIIHALANIPGLKVTARTSAFAFRDKEQDVTKIAEALRVSNILEGSVRRAGNRIRVTAQLINAENGYHLWSERYDREMADVFAIQDEIAHAIAGTLQVELTRYPSHFREYRPNVPAYEAYLRGRHHLIKLTAESWARAKECFEEAIARDPKYARPHAGLGWGYLVAGTNGVLLLREVAPLVRVEAQKALQLNPSEAGPHFLLGSLAAYEYNWNESAEHFRVAIAATSPSTVPAYTRWAYAAFYLAPFGRFRESVAELQRAVEQDPLNASWRAILSSHLNEAGFYDRAIEEALKAREIDENHWLPQYMLGGIYLSRGKFAEAIAAAERAHQAVPWHSMPIGLLAGALVQVGEKDRAQALIRQMGDAPRPVWGRVLYHLLCAEIEAAAAWFKKMIEQGDPFALIFARASVTKPLRQSSHWPELARMMNLPERVFPVE
jgi:serine/threonine-protein kinase